jgi:hypothetical protein
LERKKARMAEKEAQEPVEAEFFSDKSPLSEARGLAGGHGMSGTEINQLFNSQKDIQHFRGQNFIQNSARGSNSKSCLIERLSMIESIFSLSWVS